MSVQSDGRPPLILPLDSTAATLATAGGKGASLARMAVAGLPVPPGFLLTTTAYRRFVEANGFQERLLDLASHATGGDPSGLEKASASIRTLFEEGDMTDAIAEAACTAYAGLGPDRPAVAVRSSATAEDLPGLSFAGQQESYLNIRGEDALTAAVRRCWASLWTARAISYRNRMGIGHADAAMAVAVQILVPSDVSGVLFTADPATGSREVMVVNAAFGLGESVVSGQVTPDTYLLDRNTLEAREVRIGTKERMVTPAGDNGTAARDVPAGRRRARALPGPALRNLAELARQVEELFDGVPQDIEWAMAEERLWLLQARPITNLPPAPLLDASWEPPIPGSAWVRRQVVEHMPEPLSTLFEELYLREGLQEGMESIYAALGASAGAVRRFVEPPFFTTVNGYAYQRGNFKLGLSTLPFLLSSLVKAPRLLFRDSVPMWREEALPEYLGVVERWKRVDPEAATDEQLLSGIRELAHADARYWWMAALPIGAAKVSDELLNRFLTRFARDRDLTSGHFLRGFPSKTLEAEAELEGMAERIRASESLGALVAATPADRLLEALDSHPSGRLLLYDIQTYLDRYGHQIYTLDFVAPTQAEDPIPVLHALKALVRHPARTAGARWDAGEQDRLIEETAAALGPLRRRLFRWLLNLARRHYPYREEAVFHLGAGWPALRRLALELGRRLTEAGSLERPDDVFFLETAELREAIRARMEGRARPDLGRLARQNRDLREARKRLQPPSAVPPSFRFTLAGIDLSSRVGQQRNEGEGPLLKGIAISPGKVTARASLILTPGDFERMEPDTILVCPAATPAWTPLFGQAKGLVTDIGGILAHGSIVAREYGIPAVMGVEGATRRIDHGRLLTVDGNAGTVTLHEEE